MADPRRPIRPIDHARPIVLRGGGDARSELRATQATLEQAKAQAAGSLSGAIAPLLRAYGAELRAQCALIEKSFQVIAGKPTRAIGSQACRSSPRQSLRRACAV